MYGYGGGLKAGEFIRKGMRYWGSGAVIGRLGGLGTCVNVATRN
jgi:hypothetical protein